jgi:hypothetical protein
VVATGIAHKYGGANEKKTTAKEGTVDFHRSGHSDLRLVLQNSHCASPIEFRGSRKTIVLYGI